MKKDLKEFWNKGINPILGYKLENRNVLAQRRSYNERRKKEQWDKILTNLNAK